MVKECDLHNKKETLKSSGFNKNQPHDITIPVAEETSINFTYYF